MLRMAEVRFVNAAERYNELSVASLMEYAREHLPVLLDYLPNIEPAKIDRKFLLNVDTCQPGGKHAGTGSG